MNVLNSLLFDYCTVYVMGRKFVEGRDVLYIDANGTDGIYSTKTTSLLITVALKTSTATYAITNEAGIPMRGILTIERST